MSTTDKAGATEAHFNDLLRFAGIALVQSFTVISTCARFLFSFLWFLLKTTAHSLRSISQHLLWILRPVILVLSLLLDTFILKPYHAVVYFATEMQDVWTLVVAALAVGVVFGLCAQKLSSALVALVIGAGRPSNCMPQSPTDPPNVSDGIPSKKVKKSGRASAGSKSAGKKRAEWREL
ncbi:hypothetical protein PUNSTDRAFT_141598 [Punctularia strigosozonata HHB-11173 SS5]|uniref:uncharacterized protein n=1 Tax=Punctularia strigosozonata (strain HHB-11173) TaxID=741275 RepID=UPI000441744E|nr:uncharacterized protein PUNSTDRAFT_141598 [Punctularia strigosozonata HHB-11173 SS5]EIN11139.1 hypothetical protein PUNSTDRAFT_141598 [Punctularia strigosozonata HHB-11173 SS5]